MRWTVFLLCPVWSICNRFYFGLFIIFLPAIIWGSLFTIRSTIPIFGDMSALLLLFINLTYLNVSGGLRDLIFSALNIDSVVYGGNYIFFSFLSITYYLICCFYIGIAADKWITSNKNHQSLFRINDRDKKWRAIGVLAFLPLVSIVNHINVSIISIGMVVMP
jgi:hypothetical protein